MIRYFVTGKMMNYYCYSNGKILRKNEIKVGITDLVMLRGYGAFDYMRTYYGVPFRINDYLDRFENSANGMMLKLPLKKKEIISAIHSLLKKNKVSVKKDFGIRLLLTGGYSLDSYLPAVKPNLFILMEDLPLYPEWWSEKGIKLMLHEHSREMARVKTTNYLTAIRLADERRKAKAQDTLYCSDGKILETTRNNFFLFHGNTLVTADEGMLLGITRKLITNITLKKFKLEIREVLKEELTWCSESFITGTTRGITPVVQIDKMKIGNGKVGKNTKELMKMFEETVNKECRFTPTLSSRRGR
ncbi:MAG: aminotransferase class IV family protein [Bacteroidetes bacterium]|nr:aminotransferase class IV family protein [Bacteroidota bacterium]